MQLTSIKSKNPAQHEPVANEYHIYASYQKSVHSKEEKYVKFTFGRASTVYGWQLIDFKNIISFEK